MTRSQAVDLVMQGLYGPLEPGDPLEADYQLLRNMQLEREQQLQREAEAKRRAEIEANYAAGAAHDRELEAKKAREEAQRREDEEYARKRREEQARKQEAELKEREAELKERKEKELREKEEQRKREEEERRDREFQKRFREEQMAKERREELDQLLHQRARTIPQEEIFREHEERRQERDRAYEAQRTRHVRELMKTAIDLGLDKVKPGGAAPNWGTGIDPSLPLDEQNRQFEKMRKDDPERIQRIENIQKAGTLLLAIQAELSRNKTFVESVKGGYGDDYLTCPLQLTTTNHFLNMDAYSQKTQMNNLQKLGSMELQNIGELYDQKHLQDNYWSYLDKEGPMSEAQAADLKKRVEKLEKEGFPYEEFLDSPAHEKFLKERGIGWSPLRAAKLMTDDPLAEEELRRTIGAADYKVICQHLDDAEKLYREKGRGITDTNAEDMSIWLTQKGFNLMENSLVFDGYTTEKNGDNTALKINMAEDLENSLDRDVLDDASYKRTLEKAKKAQAYYRENREDLEYAFSTMYDFRHSNVGIVLLDAGQKIRAMDKNPRMMEKLNTFRGLIYDTRQAYDIRACKLVGKNNRPIMVDPLKEDTQFTKEMVDKECDILDTCYEMLKDPTRRTMRDSQEYKDVMKSILNVKKKLREPHADNEEARREYVKSVNKVLNNINKYRMHKAVDGMKQDATDDKLIALERVDKLLRTRYQSVEKRNYEDTLGAVPELFKVDVEEGLTGDAYMLAKAKGKVGNMRKAIEEYAAERSEIRRSNSIGGRELKEEKNLSMSSSIREGTAPEGRPRRNSIGGIRSKNLDLNKAQDTVSTYTAPLQEAESNYRKTLDPKDDYGREKLVSSAEKSLYIDSLGNMAKKQGKTPEQVEALMKKGAADYQKNGSIRYRAFKYQYLTDKDFNKEFQDNVLKGAEQGKISPQDIRQYRDDALRKCYTQYKGKDTAALDSLSETLGSGVNSRSIAAEKAQEAGQMAL